MLVVTSGLGLVGRDFLWGDVRTCHGTFRVLKGLLERSKLDLHTSQIKHYFLFFTLLFTAVVLFFKPFLYLLLNNRVHL